MDSSKHALSIYIDFSKAFDTVPHNLLLEKLDHYGIRNNLLKWFSSYLSNRSQQTIIENCTSESLKNNLGVPQGSVLGPILFLLFINDLPNISRLLHTILFADDATLTVIANNHKQLLETANSELFKFYNWCLANRLSMNISKTFYMIFSNKKFTEPVPLLLKSGHSYDVIKRVVNTIFLGIYFDDSMNFKSHITYLSQKLARIAALIYQVRDLMPFFVLKNMYYAHAQSLLSYCNLIWCNTNQSTLKPLVIIQKRLIRIITNSDFLAHTLPLFQRTKILNLDKLRKLSLGIHCFKNINNLNYLQGQHNYHTRNRALLRPIIHRTTKFEKSFIYQAPLIWNEITVNYPIIINTTSIDVFKRRYKRVLLNFD